MEKLTLEYLAHYLPYDVNIKATDKFGIYKGNKIFTLSTVTNTPKNNAGIDWVLREDFKLILRPLSDYDDVNSERLREINTDLMNQIEITQFANKQISLANLSYSSFVSLIKDHADVFGLIGKGLAIDINKI